MKIGIAKLIVKVKTQYNLNLLTDCSMIYNFGNTILNKALTND